MRTRTTVLVAIAAALSAALLAVRSCVPARGPGPDESASAAVARVASTDAPPAPSSDPHRPPRLRAAATPAPTMTTTDDSVRAAAPASGAPESSEVRGRRPVTRAPVTVPPRDVVPADATMLVASGGLRGWAAIDAAPRGLASERGAIPGRLQVHLSAATAKPLVFRMASEPPGAVRLPRDGLLRVEAGRDFGIVPFAGLVSGPAVIVLTPVEGADPEASPLRAAVDVPAMDEFAEPLLVALAGNADADRGPGAAAGGDRQIRALRGTDAGRVRVMRSGFRGFATEPTDVLVGVDDPQQILGPLPPLLTIAAGATEPDEALRIVLRDAAGRAVLRFRAGAQQVEFVVESVTAKWTAPASVVLPAGARLQVPLRLEPGTRAPPALRADVTDPAVLGASVPPPRGSPYAERFALSLRGAAAGETHVRVTADHRPDLELQVTVVAPEVAVRARRPVLLAPPAATAGEIVLSVAPPATFVADGVQSGAGFEVRGAGTSEVVVRVHDVAVGTAAIELPLRIDGDAPAVRVTDRLRAPQRITYEIDVDAAAR